MRFIYSLLLMPLTAAAVELIELTEHPLYKKCISDDSKPGAECHMILVRLQEAGGEKWLEEEANKRRIEEEVRAKKQRALELEEQTRITKKAMEAKRRSEERKQVERKRQEAHDAQMAKPEPRIGMTKEQVITQTRWGKPSDASRTTTAKGVREQWIYSNRRYLYFDNGLLTAIQD